MFPPGTRGRARGLPYTMDAFMLGMGMLGESAWVWGWEEHSGLGVRAVAACTCDPPESPSSLRICPSFSLPVWAAVPSSSRWLGSPLRSSWQSVEHIASSHLEPSSRCDWNSLSILFLKPDTGPHTSLASAFLAQWEFLWPKGSLLP